MTKIIHVGEKAKLEGTYIFNLDVLDRVSPEIKAMVEGTFPTDCYGEDILIYEAWPMRSILESAMQLAVENSTKHFLSKIDELEQENEQLRDGLMKIITVYCSNLSERTYNKLLERAFDEVKSVLGNKQ